MPPAVLSVRVRADVRQARRALDDYQRRQLPFATAKAVNATLLDVQAAARAHVHQTYQVRRAAFLDQLVKISQFATKARPVGVVGIQGPNANPSRGDLLAKFEAGGTKTAREGRTVALPIRNGAVQGAIIPVSRRPKALLGDDAERRAYIERASRRGKKRAAPAVPRPLRRSRAFVVRTASGTGAILERVGRGKGSQLRVLYGLATRTRVAASLQFGTTATRVVRARFRQHLAEQLAQALATARPPRGAGGRP